MHPPLWHPPIELSVSEQVIVSRIRRAKLRLGQLQLGRANNRERTAVEHSLAHLGHWQGRKARYIGLRKNLLDKLQPPISKGSGASSVSKYLIHTSRGMKGAGIICGSLFGVKANT